MHSKAQASQWQATPAAWPQHLRRAPKSSSSLRVSTGHVEPKDEAHHQSPRKCLHGWEAPEELTPTATRASGTPALAV